MSIRRSPKSDGRKYKLEFKHDVTSKLHPHPFRECTVCFIRDASSESPGDGTHPVIAHGYVVRHFRDAPNREAARKAALAKALASLDSTEATATLPGADWRERAIARTASLKARRREFWEAYLNRRDRKVRNQGATS
jgi:hypothetical protein